MFPFIKKGINQREHTSGTRGKIGKEEKESPHKITQKNKPCLTRPPKRPNLGHRFSTIVTAEIFVRITPIDHNSAKCIYKSKVYPKKRDKCILELWKA
jgi:hypothetical protein